MFRFVTIFIRLLLLLIFSIIVVGFVTHNQQLVSFTFYPSPAVHTLPVYLLTGGALGTGLLFGVLLVIVGNAPQKFQMKRHLRKEQKHTAAMREELEALKLEQRARKNFATDLSPVVEA